MCNISDLAQDNLPEDGKATRCKEPWVTELWLGPNCLLTKNTILAYVQAGNKHLVCKQLTMYLFSQFI